MKPYSRVCARINLDAVEKNMENMKQNIHEGTKMMAVLKTDGYGHGALPIARILMEKEYVWGVAVATLDEAVALRKKGIMKPILVLGVVFEEQWKDLINYEIRATVYEIEIAKKLAAFAGEMNHPVYMHIKLDTGMGRLGFSITEESIERILEIAAAPKVVMEGLFTHFAKADEENKEFTKEQIQKYLWVKNQLEENGVTFSLCHCSNSAGIIDLKEANFDLVRAGISLYGLYPSEEVKKENVSLIPALELVSHVIFVKEVPKGTSISYGGTFVTDKVMKIATIPIGYGDGYPRSLSNKGYVLIRGKKAPIVGRVCMDQMMVDVTDIDGVQYMDEVTLIGKNQEQEIRVETLSDLSGRFNYEFVCDLSKRIPREYHYKGQIIQQTEYF